MKTKKMNTESKEAVLLIQDELLKLFSIVANILDKSNVKHWLHSGTLLGWYRDGGFIEWDDDLDIMISYKEWKDGYNSILKLIEENGLELFDFSIENPQIKSRLKNARIYSKDKVEFTIDGKRQIFFPYIDIFFSAPVNHFKYRWMWTWYEWMYKINWVWEPGFKRFNQRGGRIRMFWFDLISYPLKVIFPNKRILRFLQSPKQSEGDWNYLTRFDYWTHRKTYYILSEMVEVDFLGVKTNSTKDVEKELKLTFGKTWNIKKYRDPHYSFKVSTTSISNKKIKKHLEEKLYN